MFKPRIKTEIDQYAKESSMEEIINCFRIGINNAISEKKVLNVDEIAAILEIPELYLNNGEVESSNAKGSGTSDFKIEMLVKTKEVKRKNIIIIPSKKFIINIFINKLANKVSSIVINNAN